MVNAEGDFVIAEPDKASWEQFQAKTKSSSAHKEAQAENKEVQDRGLECSIDKKMFIEPMKTPCCRKTFCNDCITNALIESDFVCPACQTEGVLIDDLTPDEDTSKKIQEYLKEKETAKSTPPTSPKAAGEDGANDRDEAVKKTEQPDGPEDVKGPMDVKTSSPAPLQSMKSPPKGSQSVSHDAKPHEGQNTEELAAAEGNSKKRPADDFLENPRIPKGPKAMQNQQAMNPTPAMMNGMPNMGMNNMLFNGMGMMPNMMGMPNMNMGMPMMGMPMMGMPMMGMPGFGGMNGGNFGGMNGGGMNGGWAMNDMSGMSGMNGMNGMGGMGGMNMQSGPMSGPAVNGMGGMNGGFQNGAGFPAANGAEDDAYFRKPVNPHRHQNKQRRVRPSDYREL